MFELRFESRQDVAGSFPRRSRSVALLAIFALAACDGGDSKPAPQPTETGVWEIGPVIGGQNYSPGMPPHMASHSDGFAFDFPVGDYSAAQPPHHPSVHYVTTSIGPLIGKTGLRMRYRIEAEPGAEISGVGCPGSHASMTLHFQSSDMSWFKDGGRWWATFASTYPVVAGEHELYAPLDGPWTSVETITAANDPERFAADKAKVGRVGYTFGNCTGWGHGAYATAPARFVLLSYGVE